MIKFDGEGTQAEILCAYQFNGKLTQQLEHQYKDIDLFIKNKEGEWKSCSVKDQLRGTTRGFTSVQVELELIDTDTNESIQGCFYTNQSDYYFWRVFWEGESHWCVIESSALKEFVEEHKDSLKKWTTSTTTNQKNRAMGRKYNMAAGVEVELEDFDKLGKWIPVKSLAPTEEE